MSLMPQIRKNIKPFANGKNKPLLQLSTIVADSEEVLNVIEVTDSKEYNTCLKVRRDKFPLLAKDSKAVNFDNRYHERNIMYDRIDISRALEIEFLRDNSNALLIDAEAFYQHPIQVEDLIFSLNDKYGYDLTVDDIVITYTAGNNYTITAKPYSLQYFGQDSVNIGLESDVPPPVKVASHDSVWETTRINTALPITINGVNIQPLNLEAMYNAGMALVQFVDPDLAWLVWTNTLPGEATAQTLSNVPYISDTNVNQTLTITGKSLFAKYVPFVTNATVPDFNNQVEVVNFQQSMFFTVPYAPTLDRLVSVWIDNVKVTIEDLLKPAGVDGFKLSMQSTGDAILTHDGLRSQRVQMRVNVATLPALIRSNSRFIYGIVRGGVSVPMDTMGHEVYNLNFPMKEVVVPDPSLITPFIPTSPEDYVASLNKINSGLVLPFASYQAANPSISSVDNGRFQLNAIVESEGNEARFPAFYFIKEEDWVVIQTQNSATKLGTYTLNTATPVSVEITVGTLLGGTVPVDGGRLLCIVYDIPLMVDGSFKLDYDSTSNNYLETITNLRFNISYDRASMINPVDMDYDVLRDIASTSMGTEAIERMVSRQSEVRCYVNKIGSQWLVNYEFLPYSLPEVIEESLDSNGLFVLQLMSIPSKAMTQVHAIAAVRPDAIIITVTDNGDVNTGLITAQEITQQAIMDETTGQGYMLFKHAKSNSGNDVRWTFACDYDENDLTYRKTTTVVTVSDSVLDNPVVPFNGISIQECSTKSQFEDFSSKVIVDYPSVSNQLYTWSEHDLLINANSTAGNFVKYGDETPEKRSVGRVLLPAEHVNWLAYGDFTQFPITDPTILKVTNPTREEEYSFSLAYMRKYATNPGGIPIPLPLFDNQGRVNEWQFEFNFFGFGNPSRPAPSPLPNLTNGTIFTDVLCETKPYRQLDSLFNFTHNFTTQEMTQMLANLTVSGVTVDQTVGVITDYYVAKQSDITGPPLVGRNRETITINPTLQSDTYGIVRVIAIDSAILAEMQSGDFDQLQLTRTVLQRTDFGDSDNENIVREITLDYIRKNAIVSGSLGLIPVPGALTRIEEFSDPNLETQMWRANFNVLNGSGNVYVERNLNLQGAIYTNSTIKPVLSLHGTENYTYPDGTDLLALAKAQWPTYTFSLLEDLHIQSNNSFGVWNVGFINKGKFGFSVLELDDNALKVIDTAVKLNLTGNLLSLTVTSIDSYSFSVNFTAAQLRTKLGSGRFLTIPLKAAVYRGNYKINIAATFDIDGTTTNFAAAGIINETSVTDGTPADLIVNASWILPANQTELDSWNTAKSLPPIPLAEYRMAVTQYNYTHTVPVEQSNNEYVAAIAIEKTVRERLIENRYPGNTIVGSFNGVDLLATDIIDGLQNGVGDNILLIRAPVNLVENRFSLSFTVSGIADYAQIFTGKDVPIVQVSDVLITQIQNDLGVVIENLRTALNPIANALINPANLSNKSLTTTSTVVTNTLNELDRENIGKTWVIPIGINKAQVAHLQPGSWLVVRCNNGLDLSVNTTELLQKESEGWVYTNGSNEYIIFPLLTTIADRTDVVKQSFDLDAGASVGRWAPWFTNFKRRVNFEYAINQAKQTFVEVFVPDATLFSQLEASNSFPAMIDPTTFTSLIDLGGTDTAYDDLVLNGDVGKQLPLFVRWQASQIDVITNTSLVLGQVEKENFELVNGVWTGQGVQITSYTKLDITNKVKVGDYYYELVGGTLSSLDKGLTCNATFDLDDTGGNWLIGNSGNGITASVGYRVSCEGAICYAGLVNIDNLNLSTMFNEEGVVSKVSTDDEMLEALNRDFGFIAVSVTSWEG